MAKRRRRRKLTASDFIGLGGAHNIADGKVRIAERDARMGADNRTELQKLLGEPEPSRSALAQSGYVTDPRAAIRQRHES
jgi:hypothetical protein